MLNVRLQLEGHPTTDVRTAHALEVALAKISSPTGPTWVVLDAGADGYCQAAGSDGRYVVEFREQFGEGFRHWRVGTGDERSPEVTTVLKNQRCPLGKHSPRGCPLSVAVNQVVSLHDAEAVLRHFRVTGQRLTTYAWHDVTEELRPNTDDEGDGEIRPILPSR